MDQTTPAHQILHRYYRECLQDTNLERRIRLNPGRHHQYASPHQGQSLHHSTDLKRLCFRTNGIK